MTVLWSGQYTSSKWNIYFPSPSSFFCHITSHHYTYKCFEMVTIPKVISIWPAIIQHLIVLQSNQCPNHLFLPLQFFLSPSPVSTTNIRGLKWRWSLGILLITHVWMLRWSGWRLREGDWEKGRDGLKTSLNDLMRNSQVIKRTSRIWKGPMWNDEEVVGWEKLWLDK